MSYTSDYLGRLNYITYPDGETVSYTYDAGGQVTGVTGERNGLVTKYVSRIGYDEFGQRSFIEYGNGVKTSYTYDENRRWLDAIQTTSGTKRLLQNMSYSFDKVGNVESYTNDCGNYKTTQSYSYDGLYQLVGVKGQSEYKPKWPLDISDKHSYTSRYEQSWRFDNIGNMKSKYSEKVDSGINPHTADDLNYSFENFFDENYAHRIARSDNMFFTYDANGNLINETRDRAATIEELKHDKEIADGVNALNYGIALPNQPGVEAKPYSRTYIWNERNQLKSSVEGDLVVNYRYGADGQRAVKSSMLGETLYFNNMFQMSTTAMGMRQTKHIYVGDTRIATKNNWWKDAGTDYEKYNTYWYHGDHLGSAQLVSDWHGDEYERIEYTPYGETWIEKVKSGFESINYRFTGKEQDSETGLYYYGARYLDPKYSRWLSCDPALGEYVPGAGADSSKLPGMGGVYNTVNLSLYHYAGNNPVKYTDPDGREDHSVLRMGGYRLNSSEVFDLLKNTVIESGLMGKEYSTDPKNPYVCTTFVNDVLEMLPDGIKDYLPGGQKVVNSISKLGNLTESNEKNPSNGSYVFYYDYGDGTGHTGFAKFDKEGNVEILHNGSDGNGNQCVNLRTRDNRDFSTWFGDNENGKLYYKKLEVEIWME